MDKLVRLRTTAQLASEMRERYPTLLVHQPLGSEETDQLWIFRRKGRLATAKAWGEEKMGSGVFIALSQYNVWYTRSHFASDLSKCLRIFNSFEEALIYLNLRYG